MRKLIAALSVALVAGSGVGAALAAHGAPTLGAANYPPRGYGGPFPGFGAVAPKLLSADGDPNSIVRDLQWSHWGATTVTGYGRSYEPAPRGNYLPGLYPVQLRATDLGRCQPHGPIVYRRLWRRDTLAPGSRWSAWRLWPDIAYPKPQLLC